MMPRSSKKSPSKKKTRTQHQSKTLSKPLNPFRAGMPALDSITGVKEMKRGGTVFRIIKTTETDAYDKPAPTKAKRKKSSD